MARRGAAGLLTAAGLGAGLALAGAVRRSRRMSLQGRVVVVTGGGRGFGLAIAREFLRRGCRLAICGRDGDVIARAVETLRRQGAEVFGEACDASDEQQAHAFIHKVLERFGTIDVLVNNAAQCFVGPAAELRTGDAEYALRHIFWVQYHPTMAVLPHMRARHAGRIVNITSFGGKVPLPHQAAYSAGKFAATGWSEALAAELAREGICVSTVAPPPMRDGAAPHVHFNGRVEEEFRWFTRTLSSRLFAGSADRAARVVVDAAEHGDPERTASLLWWLTARAFGLAPNLMHEVLAYTGRKRPPVGPPGLKSKMRLGMELLARSHNERILALGAIARADEQQYLPQRA